MDIKNLKKIMPILQAIVDGKTINIKQLIENGMILT